MARGFCGIVDGDGEVSITPRLPAHWQKVIVPYRFANNAYRLTITEEGARVDTLELSGPHPRFLVSGRSIAPAT